MKLIDLFEAGYTPVSIEGFIITGYVISLNRGIVTFTLEDDPDIVLALTLDHVEVRLQVMMFVEFNEEIVNGLLLSNVAALPKEAINRTFIQQQEKHRAYRKRRDHFTPPWADRERLHQGLRVGTTDSKKILEDMAKLTGFNKEDDMNIAITNAMHAARIKKQKED